MNATVICTGVLFLAVIVCIVHADSAGPIVSVSPKNLRVVSGGDGIFECTATGYPTPRVEWSRRTGGAMPRQAVIEGGRLTIPNAQPQDAGNYKCTATNSVSTFSVDVDFGVGIDCPLFILENGKVEIIDDFEWYELKAVKLTCNAGYVLRGAKEAACISGEWVGSGFSYYLCEKRPERHLGTASPAATATTYSRLSARRRRAFERDDDVISTRH